MVDIAYAYGHMDDVDDASAGLKYIFVKVNVAIAHAGAPAAGPPINRCLKTLLND